jgi:hypothetical protein
LLSISKEDISDELLLLEDGTSAFKSELAKEWHEEDIESFTVESRPSKRTEIKWAKISGSKVLETGVFPVNYSNCSSLWCSELDRQRASCILIDSLC